jgi:hypothetical protein
MVVLAEFEGAGAIAGVEAIGACDVAFAVLEGEAEGEAEFLAERSILRMSYEICRLRKFILRQKTISRKLYLKSHLHWFACPVHWSMALIEEAMEITNLGRR